MLNAAVSAGGDALALDPSRGGFLGSLLVFHNLPLFPFSPGLLFQNQWLTGTMCEVAEVYATWSNAADDAVVRNFLVSTIAAINEKSKAKNLYYPLTWMNDAGPAESPFTTYGYGTSLPKLKSISKVYDPAGVFQKLVPGFKLGSEWAG
jgi:hypothetical protein